MMAKENNTDSLKVALLSHTPISFPMVGGIADYLYNLMANSMNDLNWRLVANTPSADSTGIPLPCAVEHVPTRCSGRRWGDGFPPMRKANSLAWKIGRSCRARRLLGNVDALVIGCWFNEASFWCEACRKFRVPYILAGYGLELLEELPESQAARRDEDFRSAAAVISISDATTELLLGMGVKKEKIRLIPPGIQPEELSPLPQDEAEETLRKFGLVNERYVLFLGRLVRRKGVDLLIRAFAALGEELGEFKLAIAGTGPEEEQLKQVCAELKAQGRVQFLGKVDQEAKRALYQSCALFVTANRPIENDMEGFGIVFLEAGVFGKAVIGGDNGGVPDAVVNGKTGILVDTSRDEVQLREALAKLLNSPELRRQLGRNGRERALKEFDWTVLKDRFIDLAYACSGRSGQRGGPAA